jgi:hypothetical protein
LPLPPRQAVYTPLILFKVHRTERCAVCAQVGAPALSTVVCVSVDRSRDSEDQHHGGFPPAPPSFGINTPPLVLRAVTPTISSLVISRIVRRRLQNPLLRALPGTLTRYTSLIFCSVSRSLAASVPSCRLHPRVYMSQQVSLCIQPDALFLSSRSAACCALARSPSSRRVHGRAALQHEGS